MAPVTVNLNVSVDASGTINIFGEQQFVPSNNVIVAQTKLPVRALYDVSGASNSGILNSLFEFWEPSTTLETMIGTLSGKDSNPASNGRDYTKMLPKLVMDLQTILENTFDCSGTAPFNIYKTSDSSYYQPNNFGRLALGLYAYQLLTT